MFPSSQLASLPTEVLDNIAFHVACSPLQLGPPGSLLSLLSTCHEVNEKLASRNNTDLYARMFKSRFDWRAVQRRAFDPESPGYYEQLVHYSRALRVIRSGRIYDVDFSKSRIRQTESWFGNEGDPDDDVDVESLVTTAYLMLLEDDGWNAAQLDHAGTYEWVEKLLRKRLYEGSRPNGGWPVENRWSSCALWVFWMLTTHERLRSETEAQGDELVDLVFPIAQVQFKVCCTSSPISPSLLTLVLPSTRRAMHHPITSIFPSPPYPRPSPTTICPDPPTSLQHHHHNKIYHLTTCPRCPPSSRSTLLPTLTCPTSAGASLLAHPSLAPPPSSSTFPAASCGNSKYHPTCPPIAQRPVRAPLPPPLQLRLLRLPGST